MIQLHAAPLGVVEVVQVSQAEVVEVDLGLYDQPEEQVVAIEGRGVPGPGGTR